jgi:hypothetical protein
VIRKHLKQIKDNKKKRKMEFATEGTGEND